jgi:hypothetical protein
MKQILGAMGFCLMTVPAFALPILTASKDSSGRLATLVPDHEDAKQIYFFPNRGGLETREDGTPRFALSYWNAPAGEAVGGFLSGIFNLSIGKELKESIQESMSKGNKVSVLPVQKSFIRFAQNEEGERVFRQIFHEIDLPPYSGRPEDSIGLSATLTPMGGKMMAMQLLSAGLGSELEYCYTVKGVSPVFHAKIHMNYNKVYTHFLAQASGGRWWWKWSIRTEIEKLVASSDIKIEINGGDAKQYDYIMALVDRMTERFFVPELENRRGSTSGRYGVSYTRIEEDRDINFELKQRQIIDRDYCVSLGMDDIKRFPWLIVNVQ